MDLSQLQEGSGRSVPSTPLRTTAPGRSTVESNIVRDINVCIIEDGNISWDINF